MTVTTRSSWIRGVAATAITAGLVLLPQTVSGMDIVAKDGWRCESRPIKASIKYICSQHRACTLNDEEALIEGELTYYGLYDIEGATNQDNLLIDAYASFNTHVGYKHRMELLTMQAVPVCGMVTQNNKNSNYNNGGNSNNNNWYNFNNYYKASSCPQDGTYPFETQFTLEKPDSRLWSWLITGYHGEAVIDIYMERTMDLVGRCHVPMRTRPSNLVPSGMVVTTLLLAASGMFLVYIIVRRKMGGGGLRQKEEQDAHKEVLLSPEEEDEFSRTMDIARKERKEPVVDLVAW